MRRVRIWSPRCEVRSNMELTGGVERSRMADPLQLEGT